MSVQVRVGVSWWRREGRRGEIRWHLRAESGCRGCGDVGRRWIASGLGVAESASDGDRHGNILKFRYKLVSAKREMDRVGGRTGNGAWERPAENDLNRRGANLGVGNGKWVTLPGAAFVVPESARFSSADWSDRARRPGESAADLHLQAGRVAQFFGTDFPLTPFHFMPCVGPAKQGPSSLLVTD